MMPDLPALGITISQKSKWMSYPAQVKLGMLGRNTTDAVTPPRNEHEKMRFYDEAQVNQLLFAAKGNRNEALY